MMRALQVLALLLVGATLGAIPFVLDWSGKQPQKLNYEQMLRLARQPDRNSNQLGGLILFLARRAARGVTAIDQLGKKDPKLETATHAAIQRIATVLDTGVPDRSQAGRYPSWIPFDDAMKRLQGQASGSDDLADCIEVVVYNAEEAAVLMAANRNGPREVSERVKVAYIQLRRALDSR